MQHSNTLNSLPLLQIKKDRGDGTSGDNDSNSASRGNWWQGTRMLLSNLRYYK